MVCSQKTNKIKIKNVHLLEAKVISRTSGRQAADLRRRDPRLITRSSKDQRRAVQIRLRDQIRVMEIMDKMVLKMKAKILRMKKFLKEILVNVKEMGLMQSEEIANGSSVA